MAASRLIQVYYSYFVDQNSSCLNYNETDIVIHKRKKEKKQIRGKFSSSLQKSEHLFPKYLIITTGGPVLNPVQWINLPFFSCFPYSRKGVATNST